MEYKLLIVKNRYTKKINFKKGIEWFAKYTPLNLVVTEINTDFPLSFKTVGNATYNGVVADGYRQELRKVVPEGKFNCVCLIYGNDAPGIRVSYSEPIPLYEDTDIVQVVKLTDGGITLNHELFHSFFTKLRRRGTNLYDPMDVALVNGEPRPYYNDKSLSAKESNRTIALSDLKNHFPTIVSFAPPINTVTITRENNGNIQTTGALVARQSGATFTCKTLELPWKNNQKNISCIPKGIYSCKYTFSVKFMKYTYEILNVPNRSGIRIHSANYYNELLGCIALGSALSDINHDGQLDTANSRLTTKSFESLMQKKDFTLIIQ